MSAFFLGNIRSPEPRLPPAERDRRVWDDIKEGLSLVLRHDLLRPLTASTATMNLFGNALLPVFLIYLTRELELSPGVLGLIFAAGSVGFLIGALTVSRVVERIGLGPALLAATFTSAAMTLIVPAASGPVVILAGIILIAWLTRGIAAVVYDINVLSLRQMVTPDDLLGRVTATTRFLGVGMRPIGALFGGLRAEGIGLRPTLVVGSCGVLLAFLWLWFSPVRTLDSAAFSDRVALR